MRYRLFRTQGGVPAAEFFEGTLDEAREAAQARWLEGGIPIMIAEAPPGGLVWARDVVGGERKKVRR